MIQRKSVVIYGAALEALGNVKTNRGPREVKTAAFNEDCTAGYTREVNGVYHRLATIVLQSWERRAAKSLSGEVLRAIEEEIILPFLS